MARKSTRPTEPFTYILPEDKKLPAEEQTVFTCRPLSQQERMRAMDAMEVVQLDGRSGERQIRFRSFEQKREIALMCIIDVSNFPVGSPKPFPAKGDAEEKAKYLAEMEDVDVYLVGEYIFDHSTIGSAEKNSSTP